MLKEREFVEALRKIGFSGPICESINEIRKAVFEESEGEKSKNYKIFREDNDSSWGDPYNKAKRVMRAKDALAFERAAEGAEGEEDYEIEETKEDDTIETEESFKNHIIELAMRKGWDIDKAEDFAERTSLAVNRTLDTGKEPEHWNI